MDGRMHVAAGCAAGASAAAIAFQGGWADTWSGAAALGGLCTAAALFPDLDTASRPQRWAARALVAILGWLALNGQWREAALIGLAALLPLITHHRGWTHRWWAVPLVPLGAMALWAALTGAGWPGGWAWSAPERWIPSAVDSAAGLISGHTPAYVAMAAGYALHLMLDRRRPRRR
jgi:hypothetical protein